jgi:capsular polysaccharide biosynthesis protein
VVVPAVTVVVSSFTPDAYRSKATLSFSGRNTGSMPGDVDQARRAAARDRSLAERTLDVISSRIGPAKLQRTLELTSPRAGQLDVAIERSDPAEAIGLSAEFARQLARDQRATVTSDASTASKVAPRLVQNGLLGLALAIPLGVTLAACLDAVRRRRLRRA